MICCNDCRFLDKSRKKEINNGVYQWQYGCKKFKYIVGWISKDSELKQMGCSDFEDIKKEQMSLFD